MSSAGTIGVTGAGPQQTTDSLNRLNVFSAGKAGNSDAGPPHEIVSLNRSNASSAGNDVTISTGNAIAIVDQSSNGAASTVVSKEKTATANANLPLIDNESNQNANALQIPVSQQNTIAAQQPAASSKEEKVESSASNPVATETIEVSQDTDMDVDATNNVEGVFGKTTYAEVASDTKLIVAIVDMTENDHFVALDAAKFGKLMSTLNTLVLAQVGKSDKLPGFEDNRLAGGAMRLKCRHRIACLVGFEHSKNKSEGFMERRSIEGH